MILTVINKLEIKIMKINKKEEAGLKKLREEILLKINLKIELNINE